MPSAIEVSPRPARLAPIEGLRAIAALGVIWWHGWIATGTPGLPVHLGGLTVNLQRGLVLLGNGFNLFFVLSGFCLYLSLQRASSAPLGPTYWNFIKRRWVRLAPLFYVVCVATWVWLIMIGDHPAAASLPAHALFLHLWVPGVLPLAPPFWTLQTEWEFYVLLPLILWAVTRRPLNLTRVLIALSLLCLVTRYLQLAQPDGIRSQWQEHLGFRFIEFGWGMLAATWFTAHKLPPRLLRGTGGVLIALLIAYIGRAMMTQEVAAWADSGALAVKTLAEPVLTFGFALLLWNVATTPSVVATALSHPILQALGRWSYGLYLWHWYVISFIAAIVVQQVGMTVLGHYLALAVSLALIIPLSAFTYRWCERPFLPVRRELRTPATEGQAAVATSR